MTDSAKDVATRSTSGTENYEGLLGEDYEAYYEDYYAERIPKREITALLEKLVVDMRDRAPHHDGDEDAVLDLLDGLAGWCQSEARLLPETHRP